MITFKYEVTFFEDIQTGEPAVHTLCADHVEIVEGTLCFYNRIDGGIFGAKHRIVDAYAPGIWLDFHEFDDVAEDDDDLLDPDTVAGIEAEVSRVFDSFGKDGSISG